MRLTDKILSFLTSGKATFIFLLLTLLVPNVLLSITEEHDILERCVNIILPLGLYGMMLSLSRNLGRTIWIIFPLFLAASLQIVLLGLYGRSVIAVDMFLNLSTTNPGEAGELLGSIWPSIIIVLLLYLPSLIAAVIMLLRRIRLSSSFLLKCRFSSAVSMIIGIILLFTARSLDRSYSARNDIYPFNVCYNIYLASVHNDKLAHNNTMSSAFDFSPTTSHPDSLREIYVMVIGETSRADHWQINGYPRKTSPLLSARKDIYSYRKAMSESNTTHKSVPLLLSHLNASTYGDSIYSVKSVLTLFKEAGYHTAFISNQKHNRSFIDLFGEEADTTIYMDNINDRENHRSTDLDLLPVLDKIIDKQYGKQFIVLHTYGSHFSYRDRYPASKAYFKPDDYVDAMRQQKQRLINSYDNSIRLTDTLIDSIIKCLSGSGADLAAILYTSDHGEDIFDDPRNLFLHASPCPSYYQLHVPFFVWISNGYKRLYPEISGSLQRNLNKSISSSESFFDTTVDLAGILTPVSPLKNSLADPSFKESPRRYLDDHNGSVPIENSGFTRMDLYNLHILDKGYRVK